MAIIARLSAFFAFVWELVDDLVALISIAWVLGKQNTVGADRSIEFDQS